MKPKKISIVFLCIAVVLSVLPSGAAFAATYGGCTYVIQNGEVLITEFDSEVVNLVIPPEIDGYPVTAVADWELSNLNSMESVVIPASVLNLGEYAFSYCPKLKSITVDPENPSYTSENGILYNKEKTVLMRCVNDLEKLELSADVTEIYIYAFYDRDMLAEFSVDENNEVYKSYDGMIFSHDLTELRFCPAAKKTAVLPAQTKSVGDEAFKQYCALESITVDEGNETYAGYDGMLFDKELTRLIVCPSAKTSASIPESVTDIDEYAFYYCEKLESIAVAEGNENYADCDGMLFDKELTELIVCPMAKTSANIPESTEFLSDGVFSKCYSLISITADENNRYFSSYDGMLMNKDKSEAVYCPQGKTAVTVPSCVRAVAEGAFYSHYYLESVIIENGMEEIPDGMFGECSSLKSVTLPESVVSIGDYAFSYCESLTEFTLPDGLKEISPDVFSGCYALEAFRVSDSNPYYTAESGILLNKDKTEIVLFPAGKKSVTIPQSVTAIGDGAFAHCDSLTAVDIPDGVTYIGSEAFRWCYSLADIKLPDSIRYIGQAAFWDTAYDNEANYTDGVLYIGNHLVSTDRGPSGIYEIKDGTVCIGEYAFQSCSALTGVFIPKSVAHVSAWAFQSCYSFADIEVDAENPYYSSDDGILFNKDKTELICLPRKHKITGNLKNVYDIPDTVTKIGEYAFDNCLINTINIPSGVSDIGEYAFSNCTWLAESVIPDGIKTVRRSTYAGCYNLESVTIPKSAEAIEYNAFDRCPNLKSVIYKGSKYDWSRISPDTSEESGNEALANSEITFLETSGTSVSVSDDGREFTVKCDNIADGCIVILALYDENGLKDAVYKAYKGSDVTFTASADYTSAKVMVWNNLDDMFPVCEVSKAK